MALKGFTKFSDFCVMRLEKKFRIENASFGQAEQVVRLLPAGFQKAHPDRVINNIYFDTADFAFFNENQSGIGKRQKIRVRWYGNEPRGEAKLEAKIKLNEEGFKKYFDLNLSDFSTLRQLTSYVNRQLNHFLVLMPVLYNSYRRAYYETPDGKLRITVDGYLNARPLFEITGEEMLTQLCQAPRFFSENEIILEMKYARDQENMAAFVAQHLPFRLTKNSKYARAMELFLD